MKTENYIIFISDKETPNIVGNIYKAFQEAFPSAAINDFQIISADEFIIQTELEAWAHVILTDHISCSTETMEQVISKLPKSFVFHIYETGEKLKKYHQLKTRKIKGIFFHPANYQNPQPFIGTLKGF